jgi:hypothetical protein
MNRRTQQPPRSIPGQLRVGIQRDYVTDLCQQFGFGGGHHEAGVAGAPQELIELAQFAALPFPANPFPFRFAPLPATMEKMKTS